MSFVVNPELGADNGLSPDLLAAGRPGPRALRVSALRAEVPAAEPGQQAGLGEHQTEIDRDQGSLGRAGLQKEPETNRLQHLQRFLPVAEPAQRARFLGR